MVWNWHISELNGLEARTLIQLTQKRIQTWRHLVGQKKQFQLQRIMEDNLRQQPIMSRAIRL